MIQKRNLLAAICVAVSIGTNVAWSQVDRPSANIPMATPSTRSVQRALYQADNPTYPATASQRPSDWKASNLFRARTPDSSNRFLRTVSSLAVVAGLMLGFVWWTRKNRTEGSVTLPNDLVEVVGRVPLDSKHKAHLVRFGDRILLLSFDGPGVSKLGEIGVQEFGGEWTSGPSREGRNRTPPTKHRSA